MNGSNFVADLALKSGLVDSIRKAQNNNSLQQPERETSSHNKNFPNYDATNTNFRTLKSKENENVVERRHYNPNFGCTMNRNLLTTGSVLPSSSNHNMNPRDCSSHPFNGGNDISMMSSSSIDGREKRSDAGVFKMPYPPTVPHQVPKKIEFDFRMNFNNIEIQRLGSLVKDYLNKASSLEDMQEDVLCSLYIDITSVILKFLRTESNKKVNFNNTFQNSTIKNSSQMSGLLDFIQPTPHVVYADATFASNQSSFQTCNNNRTNNSVRMPFIGGCYPDSYSQVNKENSFINRSKRQPLYQSINNNNEIRTSSPVLGGRENRLFSSDYEDMDDSSYSVVYSKKTKLDKDKNKSAVKRLNKSVRSNTPRESPVLNKTKNTSKSRPRLSISLSSNSTLNTSHIPKELKNWFIRKRENSDNVELFGRVNSSSVSTSVGIVQARVMNSMVRTNKGCFYLIGRMKRQSDIPLSIYANFKDGFPTTWRKVVKKGYMDD